YEVVPVHDALRSSLVIENGGTPQRPPVQDRPDLLQGLVELTRDNTLCHYGARFHGARGDARASEQPDDVAPTHYANRNAVPVAHHDQGRAAIGQYLRRIDNRCLLTHHCKPSARCVKNVPDQGHRYSPYPVELP